MTVTSKLLLDATALGCLSEIEAIRLIKATPNGRSVLLRTGHCEVLVTIVDVQLFDNGTDGEDVDDDAVVLEGPVAYAEVKHTPGASYMVHGRTRKYAFTYCTTR